MSGVDPREARSIPEIEDPGRGKLIKIYQVIVQYYMNLRDNVH